MRLRNKPWAKDKLQQYDRFVVHNPEQYRGKWENVFEKDQPIHIEIGTGKGQFIVGMAQANPHINYIGIEFQESVIVSALDRLIEADLPNCKLMNQNGAELLKFFQPGDVSQIYLNFSDPWPKTRHEKRRLTFRTFLDVYKEILVNKGEIHFKTDNQGLFEYSLVSFSEYGMTLKYVSLDLHNSGIEGNIMTEYEEKFASKGNRIYRCEVQFQEK